MVGTQREWLNDERRATRRSESLLRRWRTSGSALYLLQGKFRSNIVWYVKYAGWGGGRDGFAESVVVGGLAKRFVFAGSGFQPPDATLE